MIAWLLLVLLSVASPAGAARLDLPVRRSGEAHPPCPAYLGDQLSIRLTPAAASQARARRLTGPARSLGVAAVDRALSALGATIAPEFQGEVPPPEGSVATDYTAFHLVRLPPGASLEQALERLGSLSDVLEASPIGIAPVAAIPNDSLWSSSWWLYQASRRDIHAPEAWDESRGDSSTIVAIIDSGLIPYHPDLGGTRAGEFGNLWTNAAERLGVPGVDDDRNGFVDDVWGWDFVELQNGIVITPGEDWRDADGDPNDFIGHGTAVAGVVGAITDNYIGMAGAAWNVKIMPLRVVWSEVDRQTGVASMDNIAKAVRYATRMGADVINLSLSTTHFPELGLAIHDALQSGITVVVAAGNNGSTVGLGNVDGLIYVTATDREDRVPPWANRGGYVDLAAPGAAILTTSLRRTGTDSLGLRQPHYTPEANGTSFAAPLVAAGAVLVNAARRARGFAPLSPSMIESVLESNCDDIWAQNPDVIGYGKGRLNLSRLTLAALTHVSSVPGASVGAAVRFNTLVGDPRAAFVTDRSQLVSLDAFTLAPVDAHELQNAPTGGLAAADLGAGRGLGFFVSLHRSQVGGYGGGGHPLPGWPVTATQQLYDVALGDLDGDGEIEVVSLSAEGGVWAWKLSGARVAGFPVQLGETVHAPSAIADLDGAPGAEILVVTASGALHALGADGAELPGWPARCLTTLAAAPVVVRGPEGPLVVAADPAGLVLVAPDGRCLSRETRALKETPFAPVAGDLDLDGDEDVVLATQSSVRAYRLGDGQAAEMWSRDRAVAASPLLLQLQADAPLEILGTDAQRHFQLTAAGDPVPYMPDLGVPTFFPTAWPHLDGEGRTFVFLGARGGSARAFEAGLGSAQAGPNPWPTHRGNAARTGSTLNPPAMAAPDELAPTRVTDLRAAPVGPGALVLSWSAPREETADYTFSHAFDYDIRLYAGWSFPGEDFYFGVPVAFPRQPAAPGSPETLRVAPLAEGTVYTFALLSRDGAGNPSPISNQVTLRTVDRRPAAVEDLRVTAASASSITLRWTATGEDGDVGRPTSYRVYVATRGDPYYDGERVLSLNASADAGAPESTRVDSLPPSTVHRFRVVAVDREGLESHPSNIAVGATEEPPTGPPVATFVRLASNPARVPVSIHWALPSAMARHGWLRIHDAAGRLRRSIEIAEPGPGVSVWDGTDVEGNRLGSGIYFVTLTAGRPLARARFALLRP